MVRTVLWWLVVALIAILVIAWLLGGGIGKVESAAQNYGSSGIFGIFGGASAFNLPWAVPIPQGPNISNLVTNAQQQSATLSAPSSQAETLGNPSPYENQITLSEGGATASNPQTEYVVIQNNGSEPVDISGWTLQSALTGARAYIPLGASFFQLGELNEQTDIELDPGGIAVVTTGESPVGTSFEENECSGYLEQLQQYTPPLQTQCPSPGNDAAQASVYGQSCENLVDSLPFCTFPQVFPSDITQSCEIYAQTTFSYNGCVGQYENAPNFALNDWRIYLNASRELWNSDHDTIRLLDSHGEVVAVMSY